MATKKTATLGAGLVMTKGRAAPARAAGAADIYYKSLTVKLTKDRFEAIKTRGMGVDKSSQQIFIEALDRYLKCPAGAA